MTTKSKKIKIIISALSIIVLGILITLFSMDKKDGKLTYQQVKVTRGNINIHVISTGLVQPRNRLEIKPPISGRIEKVLVKEGEWVKKGTILAWMSSNERAALLDAARSKGQAEVARWEKYYKATPIMAPIDGTIILRNVESGQTFTNQDAILALSDELSIKANVDETDLGLIKKKQKAEIDLDAYPGQKFNGIVDHIAYEAKTVNNVTTYEVDITPTNPPSYLRSGMTSNVTFLIEDKKDILIVPTSSIEFNKGQTSVKVPGASAGVQKTLSIQIGISDGKNTEIIEGLKLDDTILVPGVGNLGDKQGFNPFRINRKKKK